jgi:NAD(P)-dependent dehydrogenase (short-subunit alcohol dehydrogenase family)
MTEISRTPSFRLQGKRALATGAGRGLGLAAAAALAEAGAEVILAARTKSEIEAAREAIVVAAPRKPFRSLFRLALGASPEQGGRRNGSSPYFVRSKSSIS